MVKFTFSLVALVAVATIAAPSGTPFSFSQWVEDLIAHPDTAMTVDEAIAAAQAAARAGSTTGKLAKRSLCELDTLYGTPRAPGRDAAACVDDLARKGFNGINCVIKQSSTWVQMCHFGRAEIYGVKFTGEGQSANCNDVARTAGKIFDDCWRSDDTVVGNETCLTNSRMGVNILGLRV